MVMSPRGLDCGRAEGLAGIERLPERQPAVRNGRDAQTMSAPRGCLHFWQNEVKVMSKFLIFGHRGSPRRFPENTLASFEGALREGADGFETDLRLLSDRAAVLYHDDEVGDDACETLSATAFAERGIPVEPLAVLAPFAGRTTMILEVKRGRWEDILIEHVGAWPGIVVASFDHSVLAELRARKVTFQLGLTLSGIIVDLPSYATRLGATWVFPNLHYVDADLVQSLHAEGIRVVPWTANRRRDWERLIEAGCDGVITDDPAAAVAWRSAIASPENR